MDLDIQEEVLQEKEEKQYKDRPDWEEITGGAQNL